MAESGGERPADADEKRQGNVNVLSERTFVFRLVTPMAEPRQKKFFSTIAKVFSTFLLTFSENCV